MKAGREHGSCEVYVYSHGNDPILAQPPGVRTFRGRSSSSIEHSLISVSVSDAFGGVPTFQFVIKRSKAKGSLGPLKEFVDDDWVDIVFTIYGRQYLVIRGLIDGIRRTRAVPNATDETYLIYGRGFGKIFEDTPIWFNRHSAENAIPASFMQPFLASSIGLGTPEELVKIMLFDLMKQQAGYGRAVWQIPRSVPGFGDIGTGGLLIDSVRFDAQGVGAEPHRVAANAYMFDPTGDSLWNLAQQWSDPQFTELYTELRLNNGDLPVEGQELRREDAAMFVTHRDRPFPTAEHPGGLSGSAWFALDTFRLDPNEIDSIDTGRSGEERKNAYLLSPQMYAEFSGKQVQLAAVDWDSDDILRHGLRLLDVTSEYSVIGDQDNDVLTMVEGQRRRMRDWFCLNPYLLNGTISVGHGRPDIRKGVRVIAPGDDGAEETYYVESVTNNWAFGAGVRTSLSVTRGWEGTDQTLINAIQQMRKRYHLSLPAAVDQVEGISAEEAARIAATA